MRMKLSCWFCLVLVCAFSASLRANVESRSLGECSYYSVEQFKSPGQLGIFEGGKSWANWPVAESSIELSINSSHWANRGSRFNHCGSTLKTRKTATKKAASKVLKSEGFADCPPNIDCATNWNFPAATGSQSWSFNYQPANASRVHVIDGLKDVAPVCESTNPLTFCRAAELTGKASRSVADATGLSFPVSVVETFNLDRRAFEIVGQVHDWNSRLNDSLQQLAASDLDIAAVGNSLSWITEGYHQWDGTEIELPASLQGNEYWQYYDDCDQWEVLINSAINLRTLEGEQDWALENETDANGRGAASSISLSALPLLMNGVSILSEGFGFELFGEGLDAIEFVAIESWFNSFDRVRAY